jgi:type IV pilus assembly protein PilY1
LQEYGDNNLIQFGLMTGSYRKNISGGVLRKNVGTFTDEVNVSTDGTFTTPAVPPSSPRTTASTATPAGIVNTLNYMRIWGYDYSVGVYNTTDSCTFQLTNITEDTCTSWGNPMSEAYFESLRYFAGQTATAAYTYTNSGSKDNQLGLPLATFANPLTSANYCAPLNVLVFNASVSTNDDDLRTTSAAAINSSSTIEALTNAVGTAEGITSNSYFVGKIIGTGATATTDSGFELCTPKTIPGLGQVSGICPEGPTLAGSYLLAGLAYHARTNRIRTDITGIPNTDTRSLKVTTYGIQLATNVPQIVIPVPGSTTGQKVIIQPIYRLVIGGNLGGGALVDMKFVRQQVVGNVASGKVYINWEDSEQGGDYDQDMWGTLDWVLDASTSPATIRITTNAIAESTNQPQGFGYTISGTTRDGPHFHSGIEGFTYTDATGAGGCTNCQVLTAGTGQFGPTSNTYTIGTTSANTLNDPLWYAAKFGAFTDSNGNNLPDLQSEWDSKLATGVPGQDGVPDNYFLVTNPLGLEAALDRAFITILANASLPRSRPTRLRCRPARPSTRRASTPTTGAARCWAYGVDMNGVVSSSPTWDAGQVINTQDFDSGRTLLTFNTTATARDGVAFRWPSNPASPTAAEIPLSLVNALNISPSTSVADGRGQQRLNWLRGDASQEGATVTSFRQRPTSKLGDIVNSNPNFVAAPSAGIGLASYAQFRLDFLNRPAMIYVGGNDGMLHGFRASDGRELLAYVPSKIHTQLNKLTSRTYTHQYYVDGSPQVGDAFIGTQWRTVLVGGLGAGGQGLYALDITDPAQFQRGERREHGNVEFSDGDDPDFGYVIGPAGDPQDGERPVGGDRHGRLQQLAGTERRDGAARIPRPGPRRDAPPAPPGRRISHHLPSKARPGRTATWIEGTDYIKIRAARASDSTATPNGLTEPLAATSMATACPTSSTRATCGAACGSST